MTKYKINQNVWVSNRKKIGIVKQIDRNGYPQKVEIDGEIYNTIGLIFKTVSLLRLIILSIKSIFNKHKHEN